MSKHVALTYITLYIKINVVLLTDIYYLSLRVSDKSSAQIYISFP